MSHLAILKYWPQKESLGNLELEIPFSKSEEKFNHGRDQVMAN